MRRRFFMAVVVLLVAVAALSAEPLIVRGRITGPDGSALPGVSVELAPMVSNFAWSAGILDGRAAQEPLASVATDAAGRYALEAPRLGVWRLRASVPGYVPMQLFPLPIVGSRELPPVILWRDVGAEVTVESADHQAVDDVWVYAVSSAPAMWRERAPHGWRVGRRLGRTDAKGKIVLPRGEGEQLDIHAFVPGSALAALAEDVEEATLVVLPEPPPARRIEVRRQPAGEPLAGVVITAGDLSWPVAKSDEDGRATLELDPSRPSRLDLFAPDGGRHTTSLEPPIDGASSDVVLFPRARPVTGRVALAAPVQSAALVWPGHDPGTFVLTDAEGVYELLALPGKSFRIEGRAPGHLPGLLEVPPKGASQGLPTLTLEAAASTVGSVVDATGKPLAAVELRAARRDDPGMAWAWSDGDGHFSIPGLVAGASYQLRASKAGFLPTTVPLTSSEPARLVLEASRAAFGRVVGAGDMPVTGAVVYLREAQGAARPSPWPSSRQAAEDPFGSWTDETGRFAVDAVPASLVDLLVRSRGYAQLLVRGARIPPGADPIDLGTLGLQAGTVLAGGVTDAQGKAIAGARVWAIEDAGPMSEPRVAAVLRQRPATVTRKSGRFRVEDLTSGRRFHLVIDHDDFLTEVVRGVEAPSPRPLAVVLRPVARVAGEVVEESGQAVAGAAVSLRGQDPPPGVMSPLTLRFRRPRSTVTDETGSFAITKVAPGQVRVQVLAEGFQPSVAQELELVEGQVVADLRFVLEPGAILRGMISKADGTPIGGARVAVGGVDAESQDDGSYRVAGIPPGPRTVKVWHPRFNSLSRDLEIEPGVNAADLVLAGDWPVSGLVRVAEEGPLAGVEVHLLLRLRHEMRKYEAVTGADGRFRVEGVASGPYDVRISQEGYIPIVEGAVFEVAGAAVEDLEFVLHRGATVSGRVLGVDFDDLARVVVHAESDRWPRARGAVDYQGHYELRDLGSGDWRLIARLGGGERQGEARIWVGPEARELSRDIELGGGLVLSGQIFHDGRPLSNTGVFLSHFGRAVERSVESDYEGRFRVEDLQPGSYRLALSNPGEQLLYNLDFELFEDRELVIELAASRISGAVRDAATSEPLDSAFVTVQMLVGDGPSSGGGQPGSLISVGTNAEGFFTIERVTAGTYRASARRDGYTPVERTVQVHDGVDLDAFDFHLAPTEGLDVAARLASGRIPRLLTVSAFDAAGRRVHAETRTTSPEGQARFASLPAGTWQLVVTAPGGVATRIMATVPGEPLTVVLPEASRVAVRVPLLIESSRAATLTLIGVDGRPFEGLDGNGNLRASWPLQGGRVMVDGVPSGFWSLSVIAADGQSWTGTVAAAAGLEVEVSLE